MDSNDTINLATAVKPNHATPNLAEARLDMEATPLTKTRNSNGKSNVYLSLSLYFVGKTGRP